MGAMANANFPTDAEGHVYHVGVKRGEVANRIITVGDPARAILIATFLDGGDQIDASQHKKYLNYVSPQIFIKTSPRLFTTVTGRYKGVPVSIIAIGMGVPMMDFFVREIRAVVTGPIHIVRFGSCGSLGTARAGDLIVANESLACSRNFDYFLDGEDAAAPIDEAALAAAMNAGAGPYTLSKPVPADAELTSALAKALAAHVPESVNVVTGLDITADSFYSSQARQDPSFRDENAHLFSYLTHRYPAAECLQMETFGLFHLAKSARATNPVTGKDARIRAAACAMVFAHRITNGWIDPAIVDLLQEKCSRAVLDTLVEVPMEKSELHPEEGSVWANQ
ncbi:hypothetical protein H9P43_009310 [Blastocladiella emersonii ATCC 22665]|nr:hypothetical protein H9P43_009310 [Blastocladiella emersonii ATCC 22665]